MRINKELKKRAAADHKKTLEEYQDFLRTVLAENYPEDSAKSARRKISRQPFAGAFAAAATVFITIVMLITFLPNENSDLDDKKQYLQENILTREESIIDLNATAKSIGCNFDGYLIENNTLFFDSVSGDKLFYLVKGYDDDGAEEWKITIEVNEYFKLPFETDNYNESSSIKGNNIIYYTEVVEDGDIFIIKTEAVIELPKENLFVSYSCIVFEKDENTFFDWLNRVILIK